MSFTCNSHKRYSKKCDDCYKHLNEYCVAIPSSHKTPCKDKKCQMCKARNHLIEKVQEMFKQCPQCGNLSVTGLDAACKKK